MPLGSMGGKNFASMQRGARTTNANIKNLTKTNEQTQKKAFFIVPIRN